MKRRIVSSCSPFDDVLRLNIISPRSVHTAETPPDWTAASESIRNGRVRTLGSSGGQLGGIKEMVGGVKTHCHCPNLFDFFFTF